MIFSSNWDFGLKMIFSSNWNFGLKMIFSSNWDFGLKMIFSSNWDFGLKMILSSVVYPKEKIRVSLIYVISYSHMRYLTHICDIIITYASKISHMWVLYHIYDCFNTYVTLFISHIFIWDICTAYRIYFYAVFLINIIQYGMLLYLA